MSATQCLSVTVLGGFIQGTFWAMYSGISAPQNAVCSSVWRLLVEDSCYLTSWILRHSMQNGANLIDSCCALLHRQWNVLGHALLCIRAPKRSLLQCLETVGRRLRSVDPIVKVANRHTCGGSYVRWVPQCFAPSCAKLSKSVMNNIEISNCVTYAKAWNVGFWFALII